jgi:lipopolysaccharide/colanic/teichoic acid biosynthesis glycosyltransferase
MGNMSLVGPRPIVEPEIAMYSDQAGVYKSMKPGCAGLWQCMGRSSTTYEERVELDREYFENASLWFDWVIIVRTAMAVVVGKGAR